MSYDTEDSGFFDIKQDDERFWARWISPKKEATLWLNSDTLTWNTDKHLSCFKSYHHAHEALKSSPIPSI